MEHVVVMSLRHIAYCSVVENILACFDFLLFSVFLFFCLYSLSCNGGGLPSSECCHLVSSYFNLFSSTFVCFYKTIHLFLVHGCRYETAVDGGKTSQNLIRQ